MPARRTQMSRRSVVRGQARVRQRGAQQQQPSESPLEQQEWYHGLLPREDIILMLSKQGDYIVRQTSIDKPAEQADTRMEHVLSVYWDKEARHIVIQKKEQDGRTIYRLGNARDEKVFESIVELIKHYYRHGTTLPQCDCILMNPVPRQDWELRHEHVELAEQQQLGQGAFGEVYVGELTLAGGQTIPVAVKKSSAGATFDKEKINSIVSEVRIMQQFEHPHIVKLYGVAADKLPIMIVMQLCNMGSLNKYLEKHKGTVPVALKQRWCYEAALGMQYLHSKRCKHNDLAARNCLLHNNSVKLADFGLSEINAGHYSARLDKNAKVPVRWLAPETMRDKRYSFATDVWTFGIVMWEIMMDAAEPYPHMRTSAVLDKVSKRGYRMPVPAAWPRAIRKCIEMCWRSAEHRPAFELIAATLKPDVTA